ncbi:MAG: hypothetical protein JNK82_29040 [Myxococcaceae bacterium]|nr:hypothetical protein [Myxococcaceae bacterium]
MLLSLLLAAAVDYPAALSKLEQTRVQLAAQSGPERLTKARAALLATFDASLFPAWEGTPWNFYGTSETPREGQIACGYYVSTLLRDAGFKIERVKLAQQASERIVKTFARDGEIQRFRHASQADVVKAVRERHGPGLYIVGLDYHVGLLRLTADDARFCHSAVLAPAHATCEKAEDSAGMASTYHVVGPALGDDRISDWLAAREVPLR